MGLKLRGELLGWEGWSREWFWLVALFSYLGFQVTSPLCRFSCKNLTQMFHLLFGSIVEKTVYMKKLGTAISRSDVVVFVFCVVRRSL